MSEFAKRLTNAEELLRQVEGETKEQAIQKWWELNGLNSETARKNRKEEYERQKADTYLAACAERMRRMSLSK